MANDKPLACLRRTQARQAIEDWLEVVGVDAGLYESLGEEKL